MKEDDIEFIIKQTLIEASLHHEEDSRQRYYNGIIELVNHYKYLENKMREIMNARYNDGAGREK